MMLPYISRTSQTSKPFQQAGNISTVHEFRLQILCAQSFEWFIYYISFDHAKVELTDMIFLNLNDG